jgi:hypothetical protein
MITLGQRAGTPRALCGQASQPATTGQQSTSRGWQLLTALVTSSLMHTHPFLTEGLGRNANPAVGRQHAASASYQESDGRTISTSFVHFLTEGTKVIGRKAHQLASSRQGQQQTELTSHAVPMACSSRQKWNVDRCDVRSASCARVHEQH